MKRSEKKNRDKRDSHKVLLIIFFICFAHFFILVFHNGRPNYYMVFMNEDERAYSLNPLHYGVYMFLRDNIPPGSNLVFYDEVEYFRFSVSLLYPDVICYNIYYYNASYSYNFIKANQIHYLFVSSTPQDLDLLFPTNFTKIVYDKDITMHLLVVNVSIL